MSAPPGASPGSCTTAPAGSRGQGESLPPRVVAREFARLFAEHDIATHPADVRRIAAKFCAGGYELSRVEDFVLAYADPTGERAVRNVMRGGGDDAS